MWMRGGLLSGRQMRSPVPVHSASPSESCTSGRQSAALGLAVSENQYIEVSGARPSRAMSLRRNSACSISITTPLPRVILNEHAPATEGPSSRAWTVTVSAGWSASI